MPRCLVPAKETRREIQVSNSRFIATIAPTFSVDEAKAFIQRVKNEFSDATHNVPVFIIGHGASVTAHSSDDGEPSGTAGRPALAVLQGSELGDAAAVVTRYFGGSKLGTGGLVRAYSEAIRSVLEVLQRAEKIATCTCQIAMPYALFERVRLLSEAHRGIIRNEIFAAEVTVTAEFATANFADFQQALKELSHGSLKPKIIATNEAAIMPVGSFPDQ